MAIAFVSRAVGGIVGASGVGSTAAQTHTAGNLLVVGCSCSLSPVTFSSVDDDAGNTWHAASGAQITAASNQVFLYYAYNCLGRTNNVVRINTNAVVSYSAVTVTEFSGVATASDPLYDTDNGNGSGTSIATVNALLANPAGGVILAYMIGSGNSLVAGSGYSMQAFAIPGDGTAYFGTEYHLTSSNETATATCASNTWVIAAASFSPAAGGGSLRRNSSLSGLGASGPFYNDPLAHYRRQERTRRDQFLRDVRKAA